MLYLFCNEILFIISFTLIHMNTLSRLNRFSFLNIIENLVFGHYVSLFSQHDFRWQNEQNLHKLCLVCFKIYWIWSILQTIIYSGQISTHSHTVNLTPMWTSGVKHCCQGENKFRIIFALFNLFLLQPLHAPFLSTFFSCLFYVCLF